MVRNGTSIGIFGWFGLLALLVVTLVFALLPLSGWPRGKELADYYGSFFAAITGLGGALFAVLFNAKIERDKADRERKNAVVAVLRAARFEIQAHLAWARAVGATEWQSDPNGSRRISLQTLPQLTVVGQNLVAVCGSSREIAESVLKVIQFRGEVEQDLRLDGTSLPFDTTMLTTHVGWLIRDAKAAMAAIDGYIAMGR